MEFVKNSLTSGNIVEFLCPFQKYAWLRKSSKIQKSNRGARDNGNPQVDIYRYVTEGSFDAYMWFY